MQYTKFLLIPLVFVILIMGYVSLINSFASENSLVRQASASTKVAGAEVIGVGQAVSVQVTRATKPYLFGIVNLPTYAPGIGSLSMLHTIFFWSLYGLIVFITTLFIILERRGVNFMAKSDFKSFGGDNPWARVGKALGIGALFALIAFVLSNDTSSISLGLLVAYLEYKTSSGD